jgi:hypothetical protein
MTNRPLAVGLIRHHGDPPVSQRRRARLAFTARAAVDGYAVVEVFEVDGRAMRDEATLVELAACARDASAHVVLASEEVDRPRLEAMAGKVKIKVIPLESAAR